jgi:HEPN domain-containing protein
LTHDITELLDLLEDSGITIPEDLLVTDVLTPYAVETRYPGCLTPIQETEVDVALQLAEKVAYYPSVPPLSDD